jgi:hypothetical protein
MAKIRKNASSSTRQENKLAEKRHLCECPTVFICSCVHVRELTYTPGGIQMSRVFGKQNSRVRSTRHILTTLEMQLKIQQVSRVRSLALARAADGAKFSPHANWVYV